ncbi:MAG: C-GCAxxG-C-C family protein, partial [Mucinivorans sp.]
RLREVCGAVSGMFVLAGLHCPAADPTDRVSKTANYALVQALAAQFRSENGSIVCRELLGLDRPKADSEGPRPELRTADYYAKRPCVKCVESAARIFGEKITSKL